MNKQNTGFGLAMFMTGAIVGAATALLYAPKSGKETRDELKQKKDRVQEGVKHVKDEVKNAATEGSRNVKDTLKEEMEKDEDRYR